MHKILYFIILIPLSSCSRYPADVERALKLAGDNRAELEQVLEHYRMRPEDSLKYKAACFLVANMIYYQYYEGEQLDHYLPYYQALTHNKINKKEKEPNAVLDSFVHKFGAFSLNSLQIKKDIEEVGAAYLINNIEWAFKVRQEQPWGKNVTFGDFCEYVLPYRVGNEKLSEWRQAAYEKYNPMLGNLQDSINGDDPVYAVHTLMKALAGKETYFTTIAPPGMPHVGYAATQWTSGSCRELADFVMYTSRALGIPCGIDLMPIRGNDNVGHFWNFYIDKNQHIHMQEYPAPINCKSRSFVTIL